MRILGDDDDINEDTNKSSKNSIFKRHPCKFAKNFASNSFLRSGRKMEKEKVAPLKKVLHADVRLVSEAKPGAVFAGSINSCDGATEKNFFS